MQKSPRYLYKYYSLAADKKEYVRRLLLENEIYYARPASDFNDPLDCRPIFKKINIHSKEYVNYLKSRLTSLSKQQIKQVVRRDRQSRARVEAELAVGFKEMRRIIAEESGVFCLSEVFHNILMWSHYADSHKGVCVQFLASDRQDHFGWARPVTYSRQYPTVYPIRDWFNDDVLLEKTFLTKSLDWGYEKEWRSVLYKKSPGVRRFKEENLTAIILGANVSSELKDAVMSWIQARKVKPFVYQAKLKRGEFSLEFSSILVSGVNNPPPLIPQVFEGKALE